MSAGREPSGEGLSGGSPSAGSPNGLSVAIVSYRRADLLTACLAGVHQHLAGHRVLVWDNRSETSTHIRAVAEQAPWAEFSFAATNVGFAAAVNALAEQAGDDDLLLLNPDAELLGPLPRARSAISAPGVAAAAPTLAPDPPDPRQDAGRDTARDAPWDVAHRPLTAVRAIVAYSGYAGRLRRTPVSGLYPAPPDEVTGYLTGACLLLSRAAWRDVGPFDEEFFLYGEEADWQRRAKARGWRLRLVDEPQVRHRGQGTTGGDPAAAGRAADLLRANLARQLLLSGGRRHADGFLLGATVLDRVQRSKRSAGRARLASIGNTANEVAAGAATAAERPAVLITTNTLGYGGAERQRVVLANALAARGHPVSLVCLQALGPLQRQLDPVVRLVRQPWWLPLVDGDGRPAVLVSGTTNTEVGFGTLWRRSGPGRDRRWLVASHTPPRPDVPTYSSAVAAAIRRSDGVIALAARHWDELTRHQSLHDTHYLAPNGIAPVRRMFGWRPDEPVRLGFLGRLVAKKNPQLLIAALAGLRDLPWTLDIFGDGPDRQRLAATTPAELRERVRWRGWAAGPDEALAKVDVLCLPSSAEALPMVLLEAMTRCVPVMASAVCAVPDVLDGGRAGILVEPTSEAAWRAALAGVLADPARLEPLARAGWERVNAAYTTEIMVDAYDTAFRAALGTTSARSG